MFFGHFAVSLFLFSLFPACDPLFVMAGAGWIDLINGVFVMHGISKIKPNPEALPYTYCDFVDIGWDHSLLMALVWSAFLGLLALKYSKGARRSKNAVVTFVSSALHFAADWIVHNKSLPLYPGSDVKLGFSLWSKWGVWAWVFEVVWTLCFVGIAGLVFAKGTRNKGNKSNHVPTKSLLFVASMCLWVTPWTSPSKTLSLVDAAHQPLAVATMGFATFASYLFGIVVVGWLLRTECGAAVRSK